MKKTKKKKRAKLGQEEVTLKINSLFYPKEYVLRTADKFSEVCRFKLEGDPKGCMTVSLKPLSDRLDPEILSLEFMNHLLAEIKDDSVSLD